MSNLKSTFVQKHGRRVLAVAAILGAYGWAQLPAPSPMALDDLVGSFAFVRTEIPPAAGHKLLGVGDISIHPDVDHLKAWITAAGAAIALADLDGDGLANDMCFVDTRTDSAIVQPVPGTGDRYPQIMLEIPKRASDQPMIFPTGCLAVDLNEDGTQDLVVYTTTRPPVAFFKNGDGYAAQELITEVDEAWSTAAAIATDIDGDGHTDLMFGNYFQDGARMYDPTDTGHVLLNDSLGGAMNGGTTQILLWASATKGESSSVRMNRVKDALPEDISRGWTLAMGAADFDGDLLPEIYMGNDFGPDRMLHNRSTPGNVKLALVEGRRELTMPKSKSLGHDSFKGMGVDVADLNRDGRLDMAVSNITSTFAFLESNFTFINTGETELFKQGVAPFRDESEPLGLSRSGFSWDVRFGDFNNDGELEVVQATGFIKGKTDQYPELHELGIANDLLVKYPRSWALYDERHDMAGHEPNRFFVRGSDGRFVDIGQQLSLTTDEVTRGIATADVDGDGDLDIAFANQWEASYYFENKSPNPGAFLGIHLQFPVEPSEELTSMAGHPTDGVAARPALGAYVSVETPANERFVTLVDSSNGHSGKRSPDIHVGLGAVDKDAKLKVNIRYRDPTGKLREASLELTPAWHTVRLPWTAQEVI